MSFKEEFRKEFNSNKEMLKRYYTKENLCRRIKGVFLSKWYWASMAIGIACTAPIAGYAEMKEKEEAEPKYTYEAEAQEVDLDQVMLQLEQAMDSLKEIFN